MECARQFPSLDWATAPPEWRALLQLWFSIETEIVFFFSLDQWICHLLDISIFIIFKVDCV